MTIIFVTMSAIDVKNLLLLGILDAEEMHGYQLNQFLKHASNPIRIGKGNAYQLLAKLEQRGFVEHVEQRQGNRPSRLVYSITSAGKSELARLLGDQLGKFEPSENPGAVALNYIDQLKPQEALALLEQRQERLAIHCESFEGFSDEIRASHPGIDLLVRQNALECEFLDELIAQYQINVKDDAHGQTNINTQT
jgi:DNA-binding PadR family transcriptional regulator